MRSSRTSRYFVVPPQAHASAINTLPLTVAVLVEAELEFARVRGSKRHIRIDHSQHGGACVHSKHANVFTEEGVGVVGGGEEEGRGKERRGREEGREGKVGEEQRREMRDEEECWRDGGWGVTIVFRLLSQHLRLGSPALKAPP